MVDRETQREDASRCQSGSSMNIIQSGSLELDSSSVQVFSYQHLHDDDLSNWWPKQCRLECFKIKQLAEEPSLVWIPTEERLQLHFVGFLTAPAAAGIYESQMQCQAVQTCYLSSTQMDPTVNCLLFGLAEHGDKIFNQRLSSRSAGSKPLYCYSSCCNCKKFHFTSAKNFIPANLDGSR